MKRVLRGCMAVTLLAVVAAWLGRSAIEGTWWGALLLLAPPLLFLVPVAVTLVAAALVRCRVLLLGATALAVFVLFTFMGFSFGRPSSANADLQVLSYNVYAGRMGVEPVVQTLLADPYDIVILQECRSGPQSRVDPLVELQKRLPDWHWARSDTARELVTGSRFPVLSRGVGVGGTSLGEFKLGPGRPALRCQIDTPQGPLICYNVHFSTSYGGTPSGSGREFAAYLRKTTEIRGLQYDHLVAELGKERAPLLLGGDFNTTPPCRGPEMLSSLLLDAFAEVGQGFGYTYSHRRAIWRIDYLYSSPALQPLRFRSWDPGASDHRAIRCDYAWKGATSKSPGSGSGVPAQ